MDVDESLPISAIEHFAYCPRQAALIHVDGEWQANELTALGDAEHAVVDRGVQSRTRDGVTSWTSLPVWSDDLGIYGVCDVVEVVDETPIPIEHKPKLGAARLSPGAQQLAAQAMCLESMWGCQVTTGVLFTRKDHRRHEVVIDDALRAETRRTIDATRRIIATRELPPPVRDARCRQCSLREICLDDETDDAPDIFTPASEGTWR